jgi:hypothetical protein
LEKKNMKRGRKKDKMKKRTKKRGKRGIRQKGHNRSQKTMCRERGKKCHFRQCCGSGSIRIHIIFQDPGSVPRCLGSGSRSISYSNEHSKINWKGKFNRSTYAFWVGPVGPTAREKQVKMPV